MKLQNKTILITGASSGIGRAIAIKCAQDKPTLILSARRLDKLNEVKAECEKLGATVEVVQADVTKPEEIKSLFLLATKDGRILDIAVSNAGLGHIANIEDLTIDQINQMVDVNIKGMIIVAKYSAEVMARQKHGHIMMTSSLAGLITLPQWSVYVASKWAITGFADCIRAELKDRNVKVTTIHPGAVKTEFFDKDKANIDLKDMGEAITSEEVAEEVYEAMLTSKQRVLVPNLTKNFALIYRFFPALAKSLIEKMAQEAQYNADIKEDEPEFSYIKSVYPDKNE